MLDKDVEKAMMKLRYFGHGLTYSGSDQVESTMEGWKLQSGLVPEHGDFPYCQWFERGEEGIW